MIPLFTLFWITMSIVQAGQLPKCYPVIDTALSYKNGYASLNRINYHFINGHRVSKGHCHLPTSADRKCYPNQRTLGTFYRLGDQVVDAGHNMVRTRKGWKDQGPCTIVDANNAFFAGVNSYFLHTVPEEDQRVVLMALQRARVSAVRIFVAQVYQGSKGTNSSATADLEDGGVGVYDDSVLQLVDTLMARALEYGIKLIVTMHDRWSLDSTYTICDAYCHKFVISNSTTNKHNFYNNPEATTTFDSRLARIALHKNSLMGGKTWAELDTVILAFEIENEAQGTSGVADTSAFRNKEWWCDRATALRHAIGNSRVLISTGGGQTFEESFIAENFACKALDVVAGHSYSLEAAYVLKSLSAASKLAHASGQQIWYEEFGVQVSNADANVRAKVISGGGVLANTLRVSWMPWEVVNPNNQQDFEFWTTDALTWGAFSAAVKDAGSLN